MKEQYHYALFKNVQKQLNWHSPKESIKYVWKFNFVRLRNFHFINIERI